MKFITPEPAAPAAQQIPAGSNGKARPDDGAAPAEQPDGRRNRSVATRKKIVRALSDLVREGVIAPTAEQVSARAEVGLRTVFRHFDDMETLYREVSTEIDTLRQEAMRAQLNGATWKEKLLHSVVVRATFFERVTPFYLSTQVHRHESPFLQLQIESGAAIHRDTLYRLLPRGLAHDEARFEGLVQMLSIDAWLRLRREQGLGMAAAIRVMQTAAVCLTSGVAD